MCLVRKNVECKFASKTVTDEGIRQLLEDSLGKTLQAAPYNSLYDFVK